MAAGEASGVACRAERSMGARIILARVALPLALLGFSGCTHVVTTAERTQSFAPFANARINNEDAQIFLFRRFGAVFSGIDLSATVASDAANSGTRQFSVTSDHRR